MDLRQSKQYANYLKSIGWKVEKIEDTYVFLKHIPLIGWFAKIQRPVNLSSKSINFVEKNYHPFQFSVEPLNTSQIKLLQKLNFKLSLSPSLPTKTLQINLAKSENDLLKNMSVKSRYNINLSKRKKIEIVESKNITYFTKFWRKNLEKKRSPFVSQQKNIIELQKAFNKNSNLMLALKDKKIIAGLFLLSFDKTMYYMYAATSNIGRKYFAPTLLTWNAILLAKKLGFKTFDFDGIYDEKFPVKSWLGFTKFKKGFGGKEIEYTGCFIKRKSLLLSFTK